LSGPPGVGKTSLAKSIAKALGRKFVRISLGGVRDEAEIRGHRKTYIGAMPGKIIQALKRAGTVNPVILLDEIDKMASDFRGDPSSALLEVLDPEQNNAFNDHYLEVDYDLSKVMFIATANVKFNIPLPLLDRMEVIELSSYLEPEKVQIAQKHILPRQIDKHGLTNYTIIFSDDAVRNIIRGYTREAGVRSLERNIATIHRKIAKKIVEENPEKASKKKGRKKKLSIAEKDIPSYLKAPTFQRRKNEQQKQVGVVIGLAWTSVGGDILPVEVSIMPGKDKLTLTGKLGEVMKESATTALSYVREHYEELGLDKDFSKDKEIHIHVPEGAIPKDGPSAGITMTTAIISAASGKKIPGNIAMTGEVTLRGNVFAIGGLQEKLVAAKSFDISTVIIPEENLPTLENIDEQVKEGLTIIPVRHINDVVKAVFV
jgi:ATP-dependent Lon protease